MSELTVACEMINDVRSVAFSLGTNVLLQNIGYRCQQIYWSVAIYISKYWVSNANLKSAMYLEKWYMGVSWVAGNDLTPE